MASSTSADCRTRADTLTWRQTRRSGLTPVQAPPLYGLIKKVGRTYKYYPSLGKEVIAAGLKLKELFLDAHLAVDVAQ